MDLVDIKASRGLLIEERNNAFSVVIFNNLFKILD
jgi:hypothetical protein